MAKYTKIGLVQEVFGKQYQVEMGKYVQDLAKLGYEAIKYAYDKKRFNHRTYNLHDSYVSAVYVKGMLEESSIRWVERSYSKGGEAKWDYKTGREYAIEYLRAQHPRQEIAVLCVAAMPYAGFLERKYNIQVISSAMDYLQMNYQKYDTDLFKSKKARAIAGA